MTTLSSAVKPPSFIEAVTSLFDSVEVDPASSRILHPSAGSCAIQTDDSCGRSPCLPSRGNAAGLSQHSPVRGSADRFRRSMDAFFSSQRGACPRISRLDLSHLVIRARKAVALQSNTYARVLDVLVHGVLEKRTAEILDDLLRREHESHKESQTDTDENGVIQFLSYRSIAVVGTGIENNASSEECTESYDRCNEGDDTLSTAEKLLYVILRTSVLSRNGSGVNEHEGEHSAQCVKFAPRLWVSERTATLIERSDAVLGDMMWRCEEDPVVDSVLRGDSGDTLFNVIYKDGCATSAAAPPALSGLRLAFEEEEEVGGCTTNSIPSQGSMHVPYNTTQTKGGTMWDTNGFDYEDSAEITALFAGTPSSGEHDEVDNHIPGSATTTTAVTSPKLKASKTEQPPPCTLHMVTQETPSVATTFRLFTPLYSPVIGSSTNICGSVFVAVHRAFLGEEDPFGFLFIRKPWSSSREGKDRGAAASSPKQLSTVTLSQEFFVRVRASRRSSELDNPPELMRGVMGLLCDAAMSGTLFLRLQWLCHHAQEEMVCGTLGSYGQAAMHSLRQLLYVLREQVVRLVSLPSGSHHITFTDLLKACRQLRPIALSIEQLSDTFQVSEEETWSVEASIEHVSSAKILSALYRRHVKRRAALSASQLGANLHLSPLGMPSNKNQRHRRSHRYDVLSRARNGSGVGITADDVYGFQLFKGEGVLDVISTIFYATMQPLNAMIESWMTRGRLTDRNDEFFIVPSESAQEIHLEEAGGRDNGRGTGNRYAVNDSPSRLPCFISRQTANEVLHAGLSRLTLQSAADHVLGCAEKEERLLVGDALESGAALLREFYDAIMGVTREALRPVPCVDPVAGSGAVVEWQAYFGECNALLYPEPLEDAPSDQDEANRRESPRSILSGSFTTPGKRASARKLFQSKTATNADDSFTANDVEEVHMSDSDDGREEDVDDGTFSIFVEVQRRKPPPSLTPESSVLEHDEGQGQVAPSPLKSIGGDTGSLQVSTAYSKYSSRYSTALGTARTTATSLVSVATSALQTAILEEDAIQRRRSEQEDLRTGATRRRLTSEFGAKVDFLNQQRKLQQWRAKRLALNVDRQVAIQRAAETLLSWQAERETAQRDVQSQEEGKEGTQQSNAATKATTTTTTVVIPLSDATRLEDERILLLQREHVGKRQRLDSTVSSSGSSPRNSSVRAFSERNSVSIRPPSISVTHQSLVPTLALHKATISSVHGKREGDTRSNFTTGGGSIASSFAFPPSSQSRHPSLIPGRSSFSRSRASISTRRDDDRTGTTRDIFSGLESTSQVHRAEERTSHLSGNLSSAVLSSSYTFLVNNDVLSRSRQRQNSQTPSLSRHRGTSLTLTAPTVFSLRPPTVLGSKPQTAVPNMGRALPPLGATPKQSTSDPLLTTTEKTNDTRDTAVANAAPSLAAMLRMQSSVKSASEINEVEEERKSASPELQGTKGELFQTVMDWDHTGSGETQDTQAKWRSFNHSPQLLESRDSSFCESADDNHNAHGAIGSAASACGDSDDLCFYDYGAAGWNWGSFNVQQSDEERFLISHQKLMREMRKARTHEERISMIRNVMRRNQGVGVENSEYLQRCNVAAARAIKTLTDENALGDESVLCSEPKGGGEGSTEDDDDNDNDCLSGVWLLDLFALGEDKSQEEEVRSMADVNMEETMRSSNSSSSGITGKRKREVTFTSEQIFSVTSRRDTGTPATSVDGGRSNYTDPARMREAKRASPLWSPEQLQFGVFTEEQQEALGRVARYYDAIALRMSAFITHKALQFTLLPPYGTLHRLTMQLCDICLLQNSVVADRITYIWVENVLKSNQRDSIEYDSKGPTSAEDGGNAVPRFDGNSAIVALNAVFSQQWETLVVDGLDTMHVFLDLQRGTPDGGPDEESGTLSGNTTMVDFDDDDREMNDRATGNHTNTTDADRDESGSPSSRLSRALPLTLAEKVSSPFQFLKYLRVCGRHTCNEALLLPSRWLTNYSDLFVSLLFWKTVGYQLNTVWQLGMTTGIPEVFFFCNIARAVLGSMTQHVWFQIGGHVRAYKESLTFGSAQCAVYNFTTIDDFTWHHRFFVSQCLFSSLLTSEFASCRRQVYGLLRQVQELCTFLTSSVAALDSLRGARGESLQTSMGRAASRAPGSMQSQSVPSTAEKKSASSSTGAKVTVRTKEESKAAQIQRDVRASVGRRVQSFGALTAIFVKHLRVVQDRYLSMETDALGAATDALDVNDNEMNIDGHHDAGESAWNGGDQQGDDMRPSGSQLWKGVLQHNAIRSRTESLSYLIHTLEQTLVSLNAL